MEQKIKLWLTFLAILITPTIILGQSKERKKLESVAREIIDAAGNCALITLDAQGQPRARTMDPFPPEDDLTIWFGTNINSRKVKQISNDPRVTLYYFHKPSASYVTINGTASIIEKEKEKKQYWKEKWSAFYPDYPRGYALIKVSPKWLEVISESRGITGDTITWQPPILRLDSLK